MIGSMALRVSSPILVGRAAELAALLGALDAAAGGRTTTVLVSGEAGIGKTRLVREFAADARASGAVVLHGGCVRLGRDEGLPFAPVVEALRGLLRERGVQGVRGILDESTAELASLVPELGQADHAGRPDQRPDWARTRLFESFLVLLSRLGSEGPAVFVVEDLHWADRSTRDLLAFLVTNLRDERIVLVGTYRSDELHRRHPLRAWAGELDRLAIERVDLERLGRDDLRGQIEAITGRPSDIGQVDTIEARSGGNPFFVEELLAADSTEGELPESLRALLLARVGALSDEAQDLLGVASVAGPVVDHDVLVAVSETDEGAAGKWLREAVAAHVLVPSSDGASTAYAFRHALLHEAVYDDLLPRDRRRLHGEYARVLEAADVPGGGAGATHLAAVAHHAEAAHDLPRAVAAWLRAARAAFNVHASAESSHAYSRCLDLWDAVPVDQQPAQADLVDVLSEASQALSGTGDIEKAVEFARRAVTLEDGLDPQRTAQLLLRLGRSQWLSGDLVGATASYERAVELVEGGPPTAVSAKAVGGLASVLMLRGVPTRAIEVGRRALDLADAVDSMDARAHALNTLGAALAQVGSCEQGIECGREGLRMAVEVQSADEMHRAYACLSTALQDCGRSDEAVVVALEGEGWARRRGMWRLQGAFLEGNAANVLFEAGRWAEATDLLQTDVMTVSGVAALNHALTAGPLAVRTGRNDDAARILFAARPRLATLRDAQFTGPIYAGLVELALADGRADDVEALVDEGCALMSDTEDIQYRAEMMALAVRAAGQRALTARAARDLPAADAARQDADRRIQQLRAHVAATPPSGAIALREAEALLAGAEAEHAGVVGEGSAEGWERAASLWDSLRRPYPSAVCRLRQAEALLTAGERNAGAEAARAAHAAALVIGATVLVADCERLASLARISLDDPAMPPAAPDVVSPEGGGQRDNPFDLTERELQVLPFLAAGYTNRQIGEALFISQSTAGVHVSRILGKMGVASRVEAAAVAVRTGLTD
jgi:DNA-binding CsgD family transcriptional regulator/tetratricopeptide (TPR) repeat protein